MSARVRKIDKGSVLDIGGLGMADDALMAGPLSHIMEPELDRPIIRVGLSDIRQESPFQTRQDVFDPKAHPEDEELLESVQANGVLEPIMVLDVSSPGGSQDYQIVFGHRRVAAARLAGLDEITAIITNDEDEARILTLAENMGGRALTPYEKALALSRLKVAHPDLSVRALGQQTGIPFQTVSTLLRAYQESPPALRGMFAAGLAPGAVLDLNPIFASTTESEHPSLAKTMQGLTRRQAQGVRDLVVSGASPQDAIQTVRQPEASQHASHALPTEPLGSPENQEGARDTPAQLTPLPSLSDRKVIEDITDLTGASKVKIKRLIELARNARVGLDVLTYACLYGGSREEEGEVLQLAKLARQDSRTRRLMDRYLRLRGNARKQIKAIDDPRKVKFVSKVILGQ
jgi:ParB/RepB/Spo0J family partition protein